MEPTQTLPSKPSLTSPNSFKHIGGKRLKFDLKSSKSILTKQNNPHGGSQKIFQRRLSDKQKPVLQPIRMVMFDTDPLHLLPLMNCKTGTNSPELVSTPLQKTPTSPVSYEPLNISDPLNLNYQELSANKASRKRKKKRLRSTSICNEDEVTDIHESLNDSLSLVSPTESPPKFPKLIQSKSSQMRSDASISTKIPNIRTRRVNKKTYKHGNYMQIKMSGLEYKPLGAIYIPPISEDQRVQNFKLYWFKGKDCLEIGCGEGYIAHWISKHYYPNSIVGLDIDSGLINMAKNKDRDLDYHSSMDGFPMSLSMTHGPISTGFRTGQKNVSKMDNKINFICEDYVPFNTACLGEIEAQYDTIIFLNTSKWIHLNYGDDGLRRTFKKIFLQLKPGGKLLFEPQTLNCYKKSKNQTAEIRRNFGSIKFMPTEFITYMLSSEVGFTQSLCLAHTRKRKNSNARPLYLLTKGGDVTSS